MCNVHCVRRYCKNCSDGVASSTVIFTRCLLLSLFIVFPFASICAVLNEFYTIKGTITVVQSTNNINSINSSLLNLTGANTNMTVHVNGGWQWMKIHVKHQGTIKADYYKTSISHICSSINCSPLRKTHSDGVKYFFSSISGLIWSLFALIFVSFHGTSLFCGKKEIKCCKLSRVTYIYAFFLAIGLIPELMIIIFEMEFSSDSAFCGMKNVFNELIEHNFNNINDISYSKYYNCDYQNSSIQNLPISWIPALMMGLMLLLLLVYKPISPFVRRVINTCSCCVNRKVSDSIIPINRYFSFSGTFGKSPKSINARQSHKIIPPPTRYKSDK